jgi:murein DD-endopeptidase MepM/ murein hydrolase activator NlpD
VLAIIPLPADEAAGTFTLSFERPAGRITRQVTVADHDFGRELVFLDSAHYALVKRTSDVARDARALRGVLATESEVRRWSGKWGTPVQGARSAGYGVERFYYRAADSSRAISLGSDMKTRGTFGLDTSSASANVPSWRHAGVDLAAARKTSVNAPAAGIVADVGEYILTGRTVIIDHGQGVMTAYFHLDTVLVRRGDQISSGKRIGRVGATGLATGPHLHYGVYIHGKDVDPAAWSAMPSFVRDDTKPKSAAP